MAATRGRPVEDFPMPAGTVTRQVCAETGMLATDACPTVTTETYNEGSEPTEYCTTHPGKPLPPENPQQFTPPDGESPDLENTPASAPPAVVAPAAPADLRQLDRSARPQERKEQPR